jgi:hypothetical protein
VSFGIGKVQEDALATIFWQAIFSESARHGIKDIMNVPKRDALHRACKDEYRFNITIWPQTCLG